MTGRGDWIAALRRTKFPPAQRSMRGTLLCLEPRISPNGVLVAGDHLADAVGLSSPRTFRYQLAKAVETGWLCHETRGGNGRRSRYHTLIPPDSCRQHAAGEDSELSAMDCLQSSGVAGNALVVNSPEVVGKLIAASIDRASGSEHVALDSYRERRHDPSGARVPPDHGQPQGRIEEDTASPAAPLDCGSTASRDPGAGRAGGDLRRPPWPPLVVHRSAPMPREGG